MSFNTAAANVLCTSGSQTNQDNISKLLVITARVSVIVKLFSFMLSVTQINLECP